MLLLISLMIPMTFNNKDMLIATKKVEVKNGIEIIQVNEKPKNQFMENVEFPLKKNGNKNRFKHNT